MMREVCFLIARGAIVWSDVSSSPTALQDSRARWEAVWARRSELEEVVHSHPVGPHAFSNEDLTTMEALDAALGRPLRYTIVTPHGVLTCQASRVAVEIEAPWWAPLLRAASGME